LFARNKQKRARNRDPPPGLNVVDFAEAKDQFHHHEFNITPSAHRYQPSWLVEEKMLSTFANQSSVVVSYSDYFFVFFTKKPEGR
jgi:hypothetical protein